MNFSKNISKLNPSPTVALNAKAKELKKSGTDVYNFTVGEPHFDTPKDVVDKAINSLNAGNTRYGPAGGSQELRKAISSKLKLENDLIFDLNEIVVGIGAKELLFHIFLSILNEDDEIILISPYWVSYAEQITAAGGKSAVVDSLDCLDDANKLVDLIEEKSGSNTKGIVLNYPNNPSGVCLSDNYQNIVANYLEQKDWWIISDEIYEYMSYDQKHCSILKTNPNLKNKFIYVNGLSKSFAMTGWRVGYIAAPTKLAKMIKSLQSHSSTCLPPFIEDGAIVALNNGKSMMESNICYLDDLRNIVIDFLKNLNEIDFIYPQGAFYVFVNLKNLISKNKLGLDSSMKICSWLLNEYHIACVPGEAFGSPGYLRLSYATEKNRLEDGLGVFANAVKHIVNS